MIHIVRQLLMAVTMVFAARGISAAADEMTIRADLTEAPRGLFKSQLSLPVKPGPLTLVYPQWIPGDHGPTGPITDLAGLNFTANGKPIVWRRDLTDMYAVHLEIPQGVTRLEASLEYLGTNGSDAEDPVTSSQLALLNWNLVLLFPKGIDAGKVMIEPSLVLPPGWKYGCSLEAASSSGNSPIKFKPVSIEMLIDQPVLAAKYFKQVDLTTKSKVPHVMDIAADSAAALALSPERVKAYERVPAEFAALFGARHYERYHFLVACSDQMHITGLEHHQCSANRATERALIDDDIFANFASLLTHEYFHSWNGKHRRPAGLLSPDYQKPMKDELLWIYEGLTEYYGDVMAARVGLWTTEQYRENIASISATLAAKQGRTWRSLQDTADMASKLYEANKSWGMRRRGVDFYDEGELVWLDADTLIRQKSDGKKTLDDFCRAFHGEGSGGPALDGQKPTVVTYEASDVFETLNKIVPHDWQKFFTERLTSLSPQPPLEGITRGGWKLIYNDKPNKIMSAYEKANKKIDFRFSLGLLLNNEGEIADVVPGSPADTAHLAPSMKIIAVNGRKFDEDLLKEAVVATPKSKEVELIVENASFVTVHKLAYNGGPRYPHLERVEKPPTILDKIIESRAK